MGYLLIDHSQGAPPPGQTQAIKCEYDTVACRHCRSVIKVVVRGATRAYATKYRCDRCCGPICTACAAAMQAQGWTCTEPFLAKVELALQRQQWQERITYRYRTR